MIKGYPDLPLVQVKELVVGMSEQVEPEVHHQVWVRLQIPAEPPVDGVLEVMRDLSGPLLLIPDHTEAGPRSWPWRLSDPYTRWITLYDSWWQSQLHWIDMGAGKGAMRSTLPQKDYPTAILRVIALLVLAMGLGMMVAATGVGIWTILIQ